MDDFILIHHNKEYLKECLTKIEDILVKQYKLNINIKKSSKERIKKKIKENKFLLDKNLNNFEKVFSLINNYLYSYKYSDESKKIVEKYFWGS